MPVFDKCYVRIGRVHFQCGGPFALRFPSLVACDTALWVRPRLAIQLLLCFNPSPHANWSACKTGHWQHHLILNHRLRHLLHCSLQNWRTTPIQREKGESSGGAGNLASIGVPNGADATGILIPPLVQIFSRSSCWLVPASPSRKPSEPLLHTQPRAARRQQHADSDCERCQLGHICCFCQMIFRNWYCPVIGGLHKICFDRSCCQWWVMGRMSSVSQSGQQVESSNVMLFEAIGIASSTPVWRQASNWSRPSIYSNVSIGCGDMREMHLHRYQRKRG